MNDEIELTPTLEHQILAGIRAGGYPQVSAAAFGVLPSEFRKWLRSGEERYRAFRRRVIQAHAQARLKAEMDLAQADPRTWLKHGPGKERPGVPGWSSLAKPQQRPERSRFDLFSQPRVLELLHRLRVALGPIPGAIDAMVQALDQEPALSSELKQRDESKPPDSRA